MADPKPKRKVSKEVMAYLKHKRGQDLLHKYKPPPTHKVVDAVEDPHQITTPPPPVAPTNPAEDDEQLSKISDEELKRLILGN